MAKARRATAAGRTRPALRATPSRPRATTRSLRDNSEAFVAIEEWLGPGAGDAGRGAEPRAEALAATNAGVLRELGVTAELTRRAGRTGLLLRASSRVGAVPLLSPTSGRPDLGLVVEPRFAWSSAGEMLAGTGFKVVPHFLPLPALPQSERRVPPWVLSSIVLQRVAALLESLQRRFALTAADLRAPRGQVAWGEYATRRFAVGRALDVPCRFPDLRDDEEIRAAIHWVLRRHRESLLGQVSAGLVVHRLLQWCEALLARVVGTPPVRPQAARREAWLTRPLVTRVFREGVEALEWTAEERGLAGLSDLSGLAWRLDMEVFFEAWVEAIAEDVAARAGAALRCGRREQTRVPLDWRPQAGGTQRSLVPDVVVAREDVVVVLDAKYKRHAEEIERLGWSGADEATRDAHRADVLQALAYSTLFDAPRVVACLVYPAAPAAWEELRRRGRTLSRARVRSGGGRAVELALLAVPLSGDRAAGAAELRALLTPAGA